MNITTELEGTHGILSVDVEVSGQHRAATLYSPAEEPEAYIDTMRVCTNGEWEVWLDLGPALEAAGIDPAYVDEGTIIDQAIGELESYDGPSVDDYYDDRYGY